ncbi:TIM barrel protein [Stieleria sp. ICT_E10.1]|uniref:DUF6797 domain-containing protein n=1 Tax=Stieleria sedimenti TaxID=2976331 RepID=UPI00218068EB|nr:DUF6797 domain-containing protein [Stieleria sedimenti]MCS7469934.1 TIM barrel protein [Stieleria sedimenti]
MAPLRVLLTILLGVAVTTQCFAETPANLRDENLVAWCIVPFDSQKRGPAERAEMVRRLGLRRVAYDWRAEHVPTFEEEILQYKKHGIEYFAFWGAHDEALELFQKHGLRPQIWQMLGSIEGATQADRIKTAASRLLPLVEQTRKLGSKLGLYNHGGWGGEPENMIAVCDYLREHHDAHHVGIVYNLHHGHGHIDDFAAVLNQLKPYLLCLNLNGMTRDGDQRGQKILPLGEGEFDVQLLAAVRDSGYDGPVGLIGHTQDDVELRLRDNLDGLHWLLPQIDGQPAGPKPTLRTFSPETAPPKRASGSVGSLIDGRPEYRRPPITVECRVTLPDANGYNILVANDTKRSGDHWEIFSNNGTGNFTAYLPGMQPDHVHSQAMICDAKPHTVSMIYQPNRLRLLVDGKPVADQPIRSTGRDGRADKLAIGRLVEGGIGCRGQVHWVRISEGVRDIPADPVVDATQDDTTLLLWRSEETSPRGGAQGPQPDTARLDFKNRDYSPALVSALVEKARADGDPHRGLLTFANANSACLSCHRIGPHGGSVGPELTSIGKQRKPEELVESVLWPKRQIPPEYVAHLVLDDSGQTHQGYLVRQDHRELVLRDPSANQPTETAIPIDEIALQREVGTLMPDNLAGAMSREDLSGLLRFLFTLGTEEGLPIAEMETLLLHAQTHSHGPAEFPIERRPLAPEHWPSWQHDVNRDRVYDFYAKQANFFRQQAAVPPLLAEYPGLDGGDQGHWGNQNDTTWANDRWNQTELGSLMCGVFRVGKTTLPRGVCVRLGDHGELATCFNPDTLTYDAVWRGGFVKFSSHRHGFLDGLRIDGELLSKPRQKKPDPPFQYLGFYRLGDRVVFAYRIGEETFLDAPDVKNGQFVRVVAPAEEHPLRHHIKNAPTQWPQTIETEIRFGTTKPYAVDTIELPSENPWNALLFCGGHAFLPDGSALVCTMQGDVWRVTGIESPSTKATWRRFASGLHHALGIVVDQDGIFVLGRDQITRLHDLNGDFEADYYECFSNAFRTSAAGHDFICGLQRDRDGNFYTASGNQGLVRISPDGQRADVIATGFRNPDGLGLLPDGTVTVPASEGSWTPASMICAVPVEAVPGDTADSSTRANKRVPHYGYGGPRDGQTPQLPLAYLPRGLDNSSGGQVFVDSDSWGPLSGQLLHFSFGAGSHFLVLRDQVNGQAQAAVVPLPGEFRSGVHRGRFNPTDGQLYVTGMQGWGSYTTDDGCFQRVRYDGGDAQLPTGFHVHENGIVISFSMPLDAATVTAPGNHFAQTWNYRYGPGYGSPEFSTRHPGVRGHDHLPIKSAHVLADHRTVFLELPELQRTNQLHLSVQSSPGQFHQLFITVHELDKPYADFPGYLSIDKTIDPHPIHADLAMATRSVPNPYRKKLAGARQIEIETGTNLSYAMRSFRVSAGEPIALTLSNPDVVPHNWALAKPGTIERVGVLADRSISDPDAALHHYIPSTTDVLAYTDVVLPGEKFTVYFRVPAQPGHYPYLCTFPGHWKVMNGVMIVE